MTRRASQEEEQEQEEEEKNECDQNEVDAGRGGGVVDVLRSEELVNPYHPHSTVRDPPINS